MLVLAEAILTGVLLGNVRFLLRTAFAVVMMSLVWSLAGFIWPSLDPIIRLLLAFIGGGFLVNCIGGGTLLARKVDED